MKRGVITHDKLETQASESILDPSIEDKKEVAVIFEIIDAIQDIVDANVTVSYKWIAQRLQLSYPGITPQELIDTYESEITRYTEQYEQA